MIVQGSPSTGSGHPELVEGCDPVLTALFTPPNPHLGRYEVCTTGRGIEEVVANLWPALRPAPGIPSSSGDGGLPYSDLEALEPLDAFGAAGPYDRASLARLYGGRRARVARGWRADGGRFESITLVSPYPDASLTQLNTGTMIIIFTVAR